MSNYTTSILISSKLDEIARDLKSRRNLNKKELLTKVLELGGLISVQKEQSSGEHYRSQFSEVDYTK
jgi:hypothetical protein